MITVYGIASCGSCRKARAWLKARGAEHCFHDFRKDGLDPALAGAWVGEIGLDRLVNRRGTSWRQLDEASRARLSEASAPELLSANPTLIKRPVIDLGGHRLVGFDAATIASLETAL